MQQLFVFYVNGWLDAVCEDAASAEKAEQYLSERTNDLKVMSVLAPTLDDCWLATDTFVKLRLQ